MIIVCVGTGFIFYIFFTFIIIIIIIIEMAQEVSSNEDDYQPSKMVHALDIPPDGIIGVCVCGCVCVACEEEKYELRSQTLVTFYQIK